MPDPDASQRCCHMQLIPRCPFVYVVVTLRLFVGCSGPLPVAHVAIAMIYRLVVTVIAG